MHQPFLLSEDDLNFPENCFRAYVRPPGLDMQSGDFRHITTRDSYRSIVTDVWLAMNAIPDAWEQLAAFDFPAPNDMSLNAQENRRHFNELVQKIVERTDLYADDEGLAFIALKEIMLRIAKHGWYGYMEQEIAALGAAAEPFIPMSEAPHDLHEPHDPHEPHEPHDLHDPHEPHESHTSVEVDMH
jgi:hypothetical protein